jgi:hypothetical protein
MGHVRALLHPDPVYIPGSGFAPAPASTPPPVTVQTPVGNGGAAVESKFKPQDQRMAGSTGKVESCWTRKPNSTGQGACHVKSFHGKLTGESLEFMDRQINEWLDAHPEFEVKFCTSTVGQWSGKSMTEPNLIVQVWV